MFAENAPIEEVSKFFREAVWTPPSRAFAEVVQQGAKHGLLIRLSLRERAGGGGRAWGPECATGESGVPGRAFWFQGS